MPVPTVSRVVCILCVIVLIISAEFDNNLAAILQESDSPTPVFPEYPQSPIRCALITIKAGEKTFGKVDLPVDTQAPRADATHEQIRWDEVILRTIDNRLDSVGVTLDQKGTKRVNGIPVVETIEATNDRIWESIELHETPSDFAEVLRSRKGYQMMAELMSSEPVREAIKEVESATVFAVPDKTFEKIKGNSEELADFVIKNLIVPGRFDSKRLSDASTRWMLPLSEGSPTSGWAVRSNADGSGFQLYQIGPEGLPAKEIVVVESDIAAEDGLIHLLQGLPRTASMTRGGLLERSVCRDILESALERSDIRLSRGETKSSVDILESVYDGQAAATFDTAAICKSYLSSDSASLELPEFVPARTFTILNSAFVAGLSVDESETKKRHQIYRSAIELAQMTLDPNSIAATNTDTALPTLRDQFNAYREAVDLARYTLRLRGQTDKGRLGERDLFNPNR